MNINGSIPINVARAYGAAPPLRSTPANNPYPSQPGTPVAGGPDGTTLPPAARELVAARVDRPVDFQTPAPASPGAYQLYTRAADKIEAAVAVQLGRTIDVRG